MWYHFFISTAHFNQNGKYVCFENENLVFVIFIIIALEYAPLHTNPYENIFKHQNVWCVFDNERSYSFLSFLTPYLKAGKLDGLWVFVSKAVN